MGWALDGELFIARFNEQSVVEVPPAVDAENFTATANIIFGREMKLPGRAWTIPQAIQSHRDVEWMTHLMSQILDCSSDFNSGVNSL